MFEISFFWYPFALTLLQVINKVHVGSKSIEKAFLISHDTDFNVSLSVTNRKNMSPFSYSVTISDQNGAINASFGIGNFNCSL